MISRLTSIAEHVICYSGMVIQFTISVFRFCYTVHIALSASANHYHCLVVITKQPSSSSEI
jgi:hypothetical protein